jgi:hypothetical protein
MGLSAIWRRLRAGRQRSDSMKPILINPQTGERIAFTPYTEPPKGRWVLCRPLTLPESTSQLFILSLLKGDRSRP